MVLPWRLSLGQAAQNGAYGNIADNYMANLENAESRGDPNAANPNSSALGLHQITDDTWNSLRNKYPQLGLTADGRTDPNQSRLAARALTADNVNYLNRRGINNVTPGNAHLAHVLGGPKAADTLLADPSTPLSNILTPQEIAANPPFQGNKTAGDAAAWAAGMQGSTGDTIGPSNFNPMAGQVDPGHTPEELNQDVQGDTPDTAPEKPEEIDDEGKQNSKSLPWRLASFFENLGAGAATNGPWAASLGAGVENNTKQNNEDTERSMRIAQMNRQNALQYNQQRISNGNLQEVAKARQLQKQQIAINAWKNGVAMPSAIAYAGGKMNNQDIQNLSNASFPEYAAEMSRMDYYMQPRWGAPQRLVSQDENGNIHQGYMLFNDKGGQRFVGEDGQVSQNVPSGYTDPMTSGVREQNRQNVKDNNEALDAQNADRAQLQTLNEAKDVLPKAAAGGGFKDNLARWYSKNTKGDMAAANDYLTKTLSNLAADSYKTLSGSSRPDAQAQAAMIKSVPDITTNPTATSQVILQGIENIKARNAARQAYQQFILDNPNTKPNAKVWESNYLQLHEPRTVGMDEAKQFLNGQQGSDGAPSVNYNTVKTTVVPRGSWGVK